MARDSVIPEIVTAEVVGRKAPQWLRDLRHDWPIHLVLISGLLVAFIPLLFMLNISVKNMGQFMTKPLSITYPFDWSNYKIAFRVLLRAFLNTLGMEVVVVSVSVGISALTGYVFARFNFPGRDTLFWLFLSVLFVPGILTFATKYALVHRMGILDTYAVQVVPYIAGSQVFMTVVLRSFFAGLPSEVIEAARVDGAGPIGVFARIVLPMSRPILATMAVMRTMGFWDEWLWPMVTVRSWEIRPIGLQVLYLASDVGAHVGRQMAGYVLASLPLLIVFSVASRQFVEGLTSGAIKF